MYLPCRKMTGPGATNVAIPATARGKNPEHLSLCIFHSTTRYCHTCIYIYTYKSYTSSRHPGSFFCFVLSLNGNEKSHCHAVPVCVLPKVHGGGTSEFRFGKHGAISPPNSCAKLQLPTSSSMCHITETGQKLQ